MGFARHIIGLITVMLAASVSAVAMPMASTAAHQAEFFPNQEAVIAEHIDVHFAARAPPMAVANVAVTGAAVVEHGNGITMHGHETHVASLGFDANFDATNRTGPDVTATGRPIEFDGQNYTADGFSFSDRYYN